MIINKKIKCFFSIFAPNYNFDELDKHNIDCIYNVDNCVYVH